MLKLICDECKEEIAPKAIYLDYSFNNTASEYLLKSSGTVHTGCFKMPTPFTTLGASKKDYQLNVYTMENTFK